MVISRDQIEELIRHAREGFPNETCGMLATADGRVKKVYCLRNEANSPVAYRLDSAQQLQAMLEIDERGWELGAIFHSHTRTRAYPSPTDVKLAFYPEVRYVIVSLADAARPDVRAFCIRNGEITEEEIQVSA